MEDLFYFFNWRKARKNCRKKITEKIKWKMRGNIEDEVKKKNWRKKIFERKIVKKIMAEKLKTKKKLFYLNCRKLNTKNGGKTEEKNAENTIARKIIRGEMAEKFCLKMDVKLFKKMAEKF